MNELLKTLTARGLLQDATAGLEQRLEQGPLTAYVGLDPTADSLHVGSLVPIIGAAWLQRYGHTPIVLVGGGTGMIGDPSGKRSERPILPIEEIDRNAEAIRRQVGRFLDFAGAERTAARLRNNAEWLRALGLMEFLRDTGKHLTLGFMLQKESVRSRLETGISYTEFSYMVIQAYDFWHLFRDRALRAADRRQRPVGQHHRRHRADRQTRRPAGLRPGVSADHQHLGQQVRKE